MAGMKLLGANRCLLIATISLVTAMLPLAGRTQEAPTDEQETAAPIPQQRYVSDKLVLNVYAEADQSGGRVATIQTGDAVEELERVDKMVRVRLEDGREGWVGANYLTSEAPAVVRLRELQRGGPATAACAPDKKSVDEIALLKKNNATLQARVTELQTTAMAPGAAPVAAATPVAECEAPIAPDSYEVASEEPQVVTTAPSPPLWWLWPIVAAVLSGGLGFASGYQVLARRIKKKFGGLRVY